MALSLTDDRKGNGVRKMKRALPSAITIGLLLIIVFSMSFQLQQLTAQVQQLTLSYNELVDKYNLLIDAAQQLQAENEQLRALILQQTSEARLQGEFHYVVTVEVQRAGSDTWEILDQQVPNVYTNIGKNWTRDELGNATAASTNVAKYISLSEDSGTPLASWTQLPDELATDNLSRVAAVYALATGNGNWTYIYTFTSTGTHTIRQTGLHWLSSGDGNMIAAVLLSTVASLIAGDKVRITWANNVQ